MTLPPNTEEIEITPVSGFWFKLPEEEAPDYNIHIHVEYKVSEKQKKVTMQAWANINNKGVRFFLCQGEMPLPKDRSDKAIIRKLVAFLNRKDEFYDRLDTSIGAYEYIVEQTEGCEAE